MLRVGRPAELSGATFPARRGTRNGGLAPLSSMRFVLIGLISTLASLPLAAQTTNTAPASLIDQKARAVATNATASPAVAKSPVTSVAPDPFSDPLVQQIVARHEKAVNGDKQETKTLTVDLEKWTEEQPKNYLLLAYLGSVYTLSSRDAWPGPGKLTYLRKGGQCLEAAVAGDPTNPAVRFVRAINYYELPALFGKHRTANDDFQILVKQLEGRMPMPVTLNVDTMQAIYYYAGLSDLSYWMNAQAKDVWRRGVQLNPASKLGAKMQAELGKLR